MKISTRSVKQGVTEIFPKFILKKSSDLMIRGGDFYAVWREDLGLWSTEEQDVIVWWIRNYTNSLKNVAKRQQTVLSLSICGILIQVPLIRGINTVRNECEITFIRLMRKLYLEILRPQRLIMPVKNSVILCENVIYQVTKTHFNSVYPRRKT